MSRPTTFSGFMTSLVVFCPACLWLAVCLPAYAEANYCLAPEPPYLPTTQEEADDYGDLVALDAEAYFLAVEDYLNCMVLERERATEDTKRFIEAYTAYLNSFRQ